MKQHTPGSYPRVDGRAVVSRAGSVLLVETVRKTGLHQAYPRLSHRDGRLGRSMTRARLC
jgi:hypothetical protein